MAAFLTTALHGGMPWIILACVALFVGLAIGLSARASSGIATHPYTKPEDGGELATDMPREEGREELETLLWPRRAGRRPRGDRH